MIKQSKTLWPTLTADRRPMTGSLIDVAGFRSLVFRLLTDRTGLFRRGLGLVGLALLLGACSQQQTALSNQATFAALDLLDPDSLCSVHAAPMTAMNSGSFFVLLTAGLLTGLSHCVGMCGPLVGAFTMRRRAERQEISTPLIIFQMGRLTTYLLLGGLLGSVGYFLAPLIRDGQGILAVALGGVMVLLGVSLLGLLPLQSWIAALIPARWVSGWIKRLMTSNHPAATFGLGIANGLLPCGPVYAMALLAASSGVPLRGAGVMLIFGLGTLPSMLGLGLSASLLSLPLRQNLYRVAALLVVAVGVQLALRGLALTGTVSHFAVGGVMVW